MGTPLSQDPPLHSQDVSHTIRSLASWIPHTLTIGLLPLPLISVMTERALSVMEAQMDGIYPGEGGGGGGDTIVVFTGRVHLGPSVGDRAKGAWKHIRRRGHSKSSGFKAGTVGVISQEAAGGVSNGHIRKGLVHQAVEDGQGSASFKQTLADFYGREQNNLVHVFQRAFWRNVEDGLEEG